MIDTGRDTLAQIRLARAVATISVLRESFTA
jgi:hypothetical protein